MSVGRRYRETILALGGSRPPMDVFRAFRGREPTTDALLRHAARWLGGVERLPNQRVQKVILLRAILRWGGTVP